MYDTNNIVLNPRAVEFIRRRGRVTESHARTLAELKVSAEHTEY